MPPISITQIMMHDKMRITRLLLALASFLWAFQLLLPSDVFTRSTYKLMAEVAPEEVWAIAFLIHAIWSFYTLKANIRNRFSLALDAFLGCLLWTSSTLLCFAAHYPFHINGFFNQLAAYPPPAAMSGEITTSIAAWWHLVRHWAEEEKCQIHQ